MRALALLVVLGVFFSGCVAGDATGEPKTDQTDPSAVAPPSDSDGQIRGTITDDSLAPIAGAQIGILNSDPQVIVTSNAAGQFAMVGLLPGTYSVAAQSLGHQSATRSVEVVAGEAAEVNFVLTPIAIASPGHYETIIGEGYFACGAHVLGTRWGNLHACVFDNHKPNVTFNPAKKDFSGVLDEVVWSQSSGLTSQSLAVSIVYDHRCTPFCEQTAQWDSSDGEGDSVSSSPVRFFVPFNDKMMNVVKEDPMPLKSVTFPDHDGENVVLVFQQRMTHYITMFWGSLPYAEEDMLGEFTALPDA